MKLNALINTLVIGGMGFIGTHLVSHLIATGRQVTVLGRRVTPLNTLPEGAKYISGDFAQHDLIVSLLDKHQEVIHLAYATVPNTSFDNPLADLLQNLPPTLQLFSEAASRAVKVVLVSSGGTVYGEAVELPICETHQTKPISPYGITKLTLENYAYLYAATHGLKFVCVRPANAYGVGQRPFVGQGFIATAIASIIQGLPIKIYGEYGNVRDYLYVSDLALGIISALQHGQLSTSYNLGSGIGMNNLEVIEAVMPLMRKIGVKLRVEKLPERAFDVKANILNSSRLQADTGWKANVGFAEGILKTYEWLNRQEK